MSTQISREWRGLRESPPPFSQFRESRHRHIRSFAKIFQRRKDSPGYFPTAHILLKPVELLLKKGADYA